MLTDFNILVKIKAEVSAPMQTVVYGMLKEEKERNLELRQMYREILSSLPKGTIQVKTINGKKYSYLCYYKEGKTSTEYLGNDESILNDIKLKLAERKDIERTIKRLEKEYIEICTIVKE